MAAYGPAVQRIKYLITGQGVQRTPNTITGRPGLTQFYKIYSYQLPIVLVGDDAFLVYARRSSLTTNRHISAARMAAQDLGFTVSRGTEIHYGHTYERLVKPGEQGND